MKILYFGSDLVSVMTLRSMLSKTKFDLGVVAPPYKRPRTPLAEFHKFLDERNVPLSFNFGPEKNWSGLKQTVESENFEIGVIASFGHMIPESIIDSFPKGMLVMHPSLLPKYRGACPI
jgi:methionyl-tRNA formyltransferase